MFIDSGTLQDLEILRDADGAWHDSVESGQSHRTRVGSEALRERFLNPPHTADEILALQRAHQVLAADGERLSRTRWTEPPPMRVERYLNATWQLPRDMPPLIRFRQWYRQYLQEVERGRTW